MIRSKYKAKGQRQGRGAGGHALRIVVWVVGMAALGILLAYKFLPWSEQRQASTEMSRAGSQVADREAGGGQGDKGIAGQHAEGQRTWSQTFSGDQFPATRSMGGSTERITQDFEGRRATARDPRWSQSTPSYADAHQLMTELAQMKPRGAKFSQDEINEINRLIQDLKRQGQVGVMAIREFLESGQDVSFAQYTGKIPPEYSSLRLAMIDALAQMGGSETTAYMATMLTATTNPGEIALLAKGLEQSAPGVYRADIMNVVRTMLDQALKGTRGEYPGIGHLFGVIQDYGDSSLAIDLEKIYRKSSLEWGEFALMALTKLPEGSGVPTLMKIVNEMSGDPGAYGTRYDVALRMLTQASREYPEASEALLRLATANKISTAALIQVASALGGAEHRLITDFSYVSLRSRGETDLNYGAAETWTDAEINQRLVLIDQLFRTNPQPAAAKALENARSRLLVWKQRPMVGGRRIRQ